MIDRAEILAELTKIINKVTAGDILEEITEGKSFSQDLNIDSLTMEEIAVMAEEKLGVKIPDNELGSIETVGDAVTCLAERSRVMATADEPGS